MNKNRSIRWLIFAVLMFSLSAASFAQIAIGISVRIGPPALPVYTQPPCPGPGYLWTPGYWAWSDINGYYWVPGTWLVAPVGLLWTPGYWGWVGGFYRWHAGYWGPHVGFYGGINYGFGYGGVGFVGGEWRGGAFFYNRAVMNVTNVHITNIYERSVVVNNNHFAFNGPGGVVARPTAEEERFANERHTAPLGAQMQHERAASENRQLFASENHGRPAIAATGRPGDFSGRNVVAARAAGESYRAPRMSPQQARASESEARSASRNSEVRSAPRNADNREMNRSASRENSAHADNREMNRPASRENSAHAENRSEQQHQSRQEQHQSRQEQKQSRQEQKQQRQQQKTEHKQAQQAQKQQHEEQKHESHGPGR